MIADTVVVVLSMCEGRGMRVRQRIVLLVRVD